MVKRKLQFTLEFTYVAQIMPLTNSTVANKAY